MGWLLWAEWKLVHFALASNCCFRRVASSARCSPSSATVSPYLRLRAAILLAWLWVELQQLRQLLARASIGVWSHRFPQMILLLMPTPLWHRLSCWIILVKSGWDIVHPSLCTQLRF